MDIGPSTAAAFVNQLKADTQFLANNGVMDYSLLIGIHEKNGPAKECKSTM